MKARAITSWFLQDINEKNDELLVVLVVLSSLATFCYGLITAFMRWCQIGTSEDIAIAAALIAISAIMLRYVHVRTRIAYEDALARIYSHPLSPTRPSE
jgi:hypothetical protein